MATTFSNKCSILSEIFIAKNYIEIIPPVLDDFIGTEDYSLPLAYIIHNGYADINNETTRIIDETFETLLQTFDSEDVGFETMSDVFALA
jgi:hypothetical protein